MNNIGKYILIFLSYIFLLTGCSETTKENIIYFGIAQKPQNLDPRFQSDAASERNPPDPFATHCGVEPPAYV